MAIVKNFGLQGVGSDVQFGKAGSRVILDNGAFGFKDKTGTADASVTLAALTASQDVTLSSGNVVLSAAGGKVSIGGTDVLVRNAAGVAQIAGTGSVVLPAGVTADRVSATGAIRVNTDGGEGAHYVEYFDGSAWNKVETTGAAQSIQDELDAVEASLGSSINGDGTFNSAAFTGAVFTSPASVTAAINQVASYALAHDTLDEIFPSLVAGNVIYSNGSNSWAQAAPGSTSGVQAYDLGLTNLAAKTSTGIIAQTGNDTYTAVTVSASGGLTVTDTTGTDGGLAIGTTGNLASLNSFASNGLVTYKDGTWSSTSVSSNNSNLTVTNGDGTAAGGLKLDLAGNLAQVSGLTTVGFLVRHTDGTVNTESITGSAGRIVISNGDGDASSATIDLATVTDSGTGSFLKLATDTYGRVTGTEAVGTSDITALVDSEYVRQDGTSTMSGNLAMGNNKITGLATPTLATDAATKGYVDSAVTGLTWKNAVVVKADSNVTISAPGATIDGVALNAGDRVLLVGQTTASENGIYVYDTATTALVRAADAATPSQLNGAAVFVEQGTSHDAAFTQTADNLTDFGSQAWVQFSGAGAYVGSGAIHVTGTTISLTSGDGLTQTGGSLDLVLGTGTALSKTSGLAIVLDTTATGGLDQTGGELRIKAASVTNDMLSTAGSVTLDGDTGTGSFVLGGTLDIIGTSGQGISTSVSSGTVTITASDASSTQKGVASFASGTFAVTSGAVDIAAGGVTNTMLANSSFSITADAGTTDVVALGGSFKIGGDAYITATSSSTGVTLALGTVDVAHGGTGVTSLAANQVLFSDGTKVVQDAKFTFTDTTLPTLTVGNTTIGDGDVTGNSLIAATATNGDIVLMPNGTGSVVVGPVGAGLIQSDAGTALTVRGNTGITIDGGTGSITAALPSGTSNKVSISGPTATDYATGLAANDLVNKQYVDTAIASGASAGAVKSFQAVVPLNANGATNIGTAMPAGATVLSVKVAVDVADTGATLSVGKSGGVAAYMDTSENDAQTQGLYVAECFVTESGSVQLIGTVASSSGTGTGSARVIVQYQVAQ
jgi:hypothetical protein